MKVNYEDLINQTFEFPQPGFHVEDNELYFHNIPLMEIIKQYGTPLKITYLPKISQQIQKAKILFKVAMAKADYQGNYTYCYCTKSSHFSFILDEVLKNDVHLETSSTYDMEIIRELFAQGKINKDIFLVCNGFKRIPYKEHIVGLHSEGFQNILPVLDNKGELEYYEENIKGTIKLGIRIASEEEPNFEFYTSRLGVRYKDIVPFYQERIMGREKFELKMLHFFINTGIRDNVYYWSELSKCLSVYCELRKICPTLDTLNIGGGLPIKNSLGFEFDYEYIITEIIQQIKQFCNDNNVPEPNIFTEFGSFTVGESGASLFSILDTKQQNDTEIWYMIDSSFITTLPDTWGLKQRFILLAVNHWDRPYQRVNLGGLTCDSLDYYNSEAHIGQVFLPKHSDEDPLFLGFFHTGAYQESLGGYGGIQHCLVPAPKHVIIDVDSEGDYTTKLFSKEQSYKSMLKILGY
jgi:arginine decarboxylase